MTRTDDVGTAIKYSIPDISKDDLFAFHETHFSQDAIVTFRCTFVNPTNGQQVCDDGDYDVWEEDDLGYYEDGVKRTLTDEQIEIFRHSELEALRREQEKRLNAKATSYSDDAMEMELCDEKPTPTAADSSSSITQSSKKKKKKKGAKRGRPEPKPDLRKRTWDVVEKGLDTLDYD